MRVISPISILLLHQLINLPSLTLSFAISSNDGLYNSSDYVISLDNKTFKSSVYRGDKAWLVEFYNTWCGHCIRFASIWKALAKRLQPWNNIVEVAAVDCANDINTVLCKEHDIMQTPTLKFFPTHAKSDNHGQIMKKYDNEYSIINSLISILEKEQQEGHGASWPNIAPYRGPDLSTLWTSAPDGVKFQFIIFEKPESYLGATIILDFNQLSSIRIRRVTSENEFLCLSSKISKFPSLVVLNKDNSQRIIPLGAPTLDSIEISIKDFLKSQNIPINIFYSSQARSEKVVEHNEKEKYVLEARKYDTFFQSDLESALRYSLFQEIPKVKNIEGKKLIALKNYLRVLTKYFPIRLNQRDNFLETIEKEIHGKSNISGQDFKELVYNASEGFLINNKYLGCELYTCGLWLIFHTLTIAAANDISNKHVNNNISEVLRTMHGYVENFFGCETCVRHFLQMSERRKLFEAQGGDESVLWLWEAHNEVNERLALEENANQILQKIQYPSRAHCPACRDSNDEWVKNEVLKYLKDKYNKSNINYQGIELNNTNSNDFTTRADKNGWDFTIFDISIIVVLYIVSAAILMLVFIKFAVKRSSKKRFSLSHFLGTV